MGRFRNVVFAQKRVGAGVAIGIVVFLLGLLTAVAVQLVARDRTPESAQSESPRGLHPRFPPEWGPFIDGRRVTIPQAEQAVAFHIFRPNDPLASDASITAVWVEPARGDPAALPQAAVDYQSGIQVLLEPTNRDPLDLFQGLARSFNVPPEEVIGTVHGGPALVVPPGYQRPGTEGGVMMVLDGIKITVLGYFPSEDLVRVAESIA